MTASEQSFKEALQRCAASAKILRRNRRLKPYEQIQAKALIRRLLKRVRQIDIARELDVSSSVVYLWKSEINVPLLFTFEKLRDLEMRLGGKRSKAGYTPSPR